MPVLGEMREHELIALLAGDRVARGRAAREIERERRRLDLACRTRIERREHLGIGGDDGQVRGIRAANRE